MTNPFNDPQTQRTRFSLSPIPSSPLPQPPLSYPPVPYQTLNYHRSDVGFDREGVEVNGQHVPWVAGEDDDELKPLTEG